MKKLILACLAAGFALVGLTSVAQAAGSYPLQKPEPQSWSFSGPFGSYDLQQLQRGFKVYSEVCASCHSMDLIRFRNLTDLGFSEDQILSLIDENGYEVLGEPNLDGDVDFRAAKLTDTWPSPWENEAQGAALNNGAYPPDFSKLAMARAVERGFPTFVVDIFTQYAESGPDYIYALLTSYDLEPKNPDEIAEGTHYNPAFIAGSALAMANPLSDELVEYTDGSPMTVDQYARDVASFMMWAAEPTLPQRKAMGLVVMIFLIIFASLLYMLKRRVWSDVSH